MRSRTSDDGVKTQDKWNIYFTLVREYQGARTCVLPGRLTYERDTRRKAGRAGHSAHSGHSGNSGMWYRRNRDELL